MCVPRVWCVLRLLDGSRLLYIWRLLNILGWSLLISRLLRLAVSVLRRWRLSARWLCRLVGGLLWALGRTDVRHVDSYGSVVTDVVSTSSSSQHRRCWRKIMTRSRTVVTVLVASSSGRGDGCSWIIGITGQYRTEINLEPNLWTGLNLIEVSGYCSHHDYDAPGTDDVLLLCVHGLLRLLICVIWHLSIHEASSHNSG